MNTIQNISLAFSPSFVGNIFRMDGDKEWPVEARHMEFTKDIFRHIYI
jgi:hypothetical protein